MATTELEFDEPDDILDRISERQQSRLHEYSTDDALKVANSISFSRFDFEQALLDCWHVTTDIEHIYEAEESLSPDRRANVLLGLKELYEIKFNKLWKLFELGNKAGKL